MLRVKSKRDIARPANYLKVCLRRELRRNTGYHPDCIPRAQLVQLETIGNCSFADLAENSSFVILQKRENTFPHEYVFHSNPRQLSSTGKVLKLTLNDYEKGPGGNLVAKGHMTHHHRII